MISINMVAQQDNSEKVNIVEGKDRLLYQELVSCRASLLLHQREHAFQS